MAIAVRDLREREIERQEKKFEARHTDLPAVIKSVDGFTRPPGQQSMTWVSILNQPESRVLVHNATSADVAETPVWVGPETKPPFRLEIKGLYFGGLSQEQAHAASGLNVAKHAQSHQYPTESNPGPDPVLVFQQAIQPLKTTGNGVTMTVTVQPLKYFHNGRPIYFSGANVDLTSYVPTTSSKTLRVLIYLDEETNTIDVSSSSEVVSGGATEPSYPDLPENARPSGYIQLTYGQTAVTTATHIEGWRDLLNNDSPYDSTLDSELKNFTMTVAVNATASGAVNIDYQDGNIHELTLTGNVTLSIVNPPSTGLYGELTIKIQQDGTGSRTRAWPNEVYWPGATVPTMTSAANAIDVYKLFTTDGGATYVGWTIGQDFLRVAVVEVDTLTLAGSAETITVVAGAVAVVVNTLTLAGSAEAITVA